MQEQLIYDWNGAARSQAPIRPAFKIVDETLRDGIQSPSIRNPVVEEKVELLHLMAACGIEVADVGLPGAGATAISDVTRLVTEVRDQRLPITVTCAARTHPADIEAVVRIADDTGVPIEVYAFLGSSPVRRMVEGWDTAHLVELVTNAGDQVRKAGLPFAFVTEDTTRSDPETLRTVFLAAIEHGASRLVLCDTCGHATPDGVANLVAFARGVIAETGEPVELDWHGHNDRGLALTLALSALEAGVDRAHGTVLGVGERVGNTAIDMLLVNLQLIGVLENDISPLAAYVRRVSETYHVPIPPSYPVFGTDAFRTATGVHAAAIVKALAAGRRDLADVVYSSVPAAKFGCRQTIEVGFYSGRANALGWLVAHELEITEERVAAILDLAKRSRTTLTDSEILQALAAASLVN